MELTEEERKQRKKEIDRIYYLKHKEELKKRRKERYQEDKEKELERNKKYHDSHIDEIKEYQKQYNIGNNEKIKEYKKEYYGKQYGRASRLESHYKGEDEKHNRGECTIDRYYIMENIFTQSCVYCGESDWMKLGCDRKDSSLPHTPENCVPSCFPCNRKKGNTPYEEYMKKVGK